MIVHLRKFVIIYQLLLVLLIYNTKVQYNLTIKSILFMKNILQVLIITI